jgi:paired amphipathic helix protein Sin3a
LKALRIQLIGDEDASVDEDEGGIGRWREYVASYVTRHGTEWISTSDGKKMSGGDPFLSRYVAVAGLQATRILRAIIRNLASREEEGARIESDGDLAVRIVGGKYKMLYEAGTEHTLRRVMGAAEVAQLEHKARLRREERQQSRWFG